MGKRAQVIDPEEHQRLLDKVARLESELESYRGMGREERFRTIWEISSEAMVLSDPQGTVLDANPAYYCLYGYSPEEVLNQNFALIFPEQGRALARQKYLEVFARPVTPAAYETTIQRKNGEMRRVESRVVFVEEGGRRVAMLSILHDITERVEVENRLRDSETKLNIAMESAGMGTWVYDLDSGLIQFGEHASKLYDASEEWISHDAMCAEKMHPDDIPAMLAAVKAARDLDGDGSYHCHYRIRRLDGGWRWVSAWGLVQYEGEGAERRAVRMIGTSRDISKSRQVEEALRENEQRLDMLMQVSPDLIWSALPDGRPDYLNKASQDYFGKSVEEFQRDGWPSVNHPDDVAELERHWAEATARKEPFEAEIRYRKHDGSYRWFWERSVPVVDERGNIIRWVGFTRDIQERKEAEEQLAYQASLLENVHDAIIATDADLRITVWNKAAEELYGYTAGEVLGKTMRQVLRGEYDEGQLQRALEQISRTGRYMVEMVHQTKDGRRVVVEGSTIARLDERGKVVGYISANRDLTERRRAEEALRESEEMLRSAFHNAAIGFAMTTSDGKFVNANQAYVQISGYSLDELRNTNFEQMVHPDDWENNQVLNNQMISGQIPDFVLENRYIRKDGQVVWVRKSVSMVRGPDHQPKWFIALVEDITERKQWQDALQESENRFRVMADGTTVIIWVTDAAGNLEFINQAYTDFFGVSIEQVRETSWSMKVHPDEEKSYVRRYLQCLRERTPFRAQARVLRKDGEWRWVDSHGQPRFSEAGEFMGMAGSSMDITERKKAEEALRQSRELLDAIIDNASAAIFAKDLEGRFIISNDYHAAILGLPPEEVIGKKDTELARTQIYSEGYGANDQQVIRSGQPLELEENAPGLDGSERTYLSIKFPLRDTLGKVYAVGGIATDITERKQNEEAINRYAEQLEQLNRELEHANKELKDFAYIASHDLQEPLRKVTKFGEMLESHYGAQLEGSGREYIARMINASQRMDKMVNGLLDYSRISTRGNPFEPVDLAKVVQEVLADLEVRIEQSGAEVVVGDLPVIEADPLQMRQLLQNLISNALKFQPPDRLPSLRIWSEDGSTGEGISGIRIYIEDNGIGIEEKHLDRLFLPFSRLHGRSEFEGTGMGLAICRKIVERHGGSIQASGKPGKGATFTVTLPKQQPKSSGQKDR